MEAIEEPPKDHGQILKRKRTNRQKPQYRIPFSLADCSSSGDDGYAASTFTSVESAFTEEEEYVANCLILLSQGPPREPPSSVPNRGGHDHENIKSRLFKSKRYLEAPSSLGAYVYQCKTCDRTFPSFQALGGHRTSHMRPKTAVDDNQLQQFKNHMSCNRPSCDYPQSLSKIHECSICGAKFESGQALGGHMRCHRASMGTNTSSSLSLPSPNQDQWSLDLDLNLPAPEDDYLLDSKEDFASKQQQEQSQQQQQEQSQQSPLALSTAPTLVDSHY